MKVTIVFAFLVLSLSATASAQQTTAFSYQGKLNSNSLPANGLYDFRFEVYKNPTTTEVLGVVNATNVQVSSGVFAVLLDFGAEPFIDGADAYLDISVKLPSESTFTRLTPRQKIASVPYSTRALSAQTADSSSSAQTAVTAFSVSGVVGIANGGTGATNPTAARANLELGTLATVTPTGVADSTTFLRGDNTWSPGVAGPEGPQGPPGPVDIVASINTQFSQDDRVGWTHIETLSDDTCTGNIPLGFTFTGWGRSNPTISVSSNGVLFFGQNCNAAFANQALPSDISNDPFVAFFWDDLFDYGADGFFEYQTSGSAGGRVFNLYFRGRLLSSNCGTNAINLMLSIHEGSNLVRISYSQMSGCFEMRGGAATFGMQGPGGVNARVFNAGTNTPILDDNADRNMISYLPPRQ